MRRFFALVLALAAVLAPVFERIHYRLPSVSWFYGFGSSLESYFSRSEQASDGVSKAYEWGGFAIGILCSLGLLWFAYRLWNGKAFKMDPIMERRLERFRRIRRGWVSLWILALLVFCACLDFVLVGNRALMVVQPGQVDFPAFRQSLLTKSHFGLEGDEAADYRELKKMSQDGEFDGTVILPVVPWNQVSDSDEELHIPLTVTEEGRVFLKGKKYSGVATSYHSEDRDMRWRQVRVRDGFLQGSEERYDDQGTLNGFVRWEKGLAVETSEGLALGGEGDSAAMNAALYQTLYQPLPPNWERRHFLGTSSRNWDVLAQLFGGLQVILRGLVLYLAVVYTMGILIGTAMGYFGGVFDMFVHRMTEILSAVPLLLVIMILTNNLGKEKVSVVILVGLFCVFRWIGIALLMRTTTYREKSRDYVAAARSLGANNFRILTKHILPNTLAIIVTLVPFEVVFFSGFLTSLDFIGFGLGEAYPSWGRLMADGLSALNSPWIVSSVFGILVVVLLLFTFVGEALREAFDPKKYSTYK